MSTDKAARRLKRDVIDQGLCVGCGACLGYCPYFRKYKGKVVLLDDCILSCDENSGYCYRYCPRTSLDVRALSQHLLGEPYGLDGYGTALRILMARSTDTVIQRKAQDGGMVTTLMTLAMEEGVIDAVITTNKINCTSPSGRAARNRPEVISAAGNSYEPSYILEALNQLPGDSNERLGLVGLPCQVESLGKMRIDPPSKRSAIGNVKLVLGLFCGWVLRSEPFQKLLREIVDPSSITKLDIPHHPADTLDIYTPDGVTKVKLDIIRPLINPACTYCVDMTSEFADISIGSGRRILGWNTVIVRTKFGMALIERGLRKGLISTQPLPEESLTNLRRASLNKKKRAMLQIVTKSGSQSNLLFMGASGDIGKELLSLP